MSADQGRYKIVRFYADKGKRSRTVRRGLTLDEAQAHCSDPETSSRTCTTAAAKARTRKFGAWFEGYDSE